MYALLASAAATLFNQLLRTVVVKFVLFGALALVVNELLPLIVSALLPSGTSGLDSTINGLDDAFFFYAETFMVFQGLSICLAALTTRFIIRRIPFFG